MNTDVPPGFEITSEETETRISEDSIITEYKRQWRRRIPVRDLLLFAVACAAFGFDIAIVVLRLMGWHK